MAGENLVYMEQARKAVALGLVARKNVVLWGPGGHAKSELIAQYFAELEQQGVKTHIQTLSVETNVMDLFGGLDPDYVKQHIYDRPRVEESWIANADVVCFEEGFDAPPRVLAALKDLLMSRVWRYQDTEVALRPRSVIILTNHDPKDIAELDASVSALVERFPISHEVMWTHYRGDSYQYMFDVLDGEQTVKGEFVLPDWATIEAIEPAHMNRDLVEYLSAIFGTATGLKVKLSPRTAVFGRSMVENWAALTGAEEVSEDHFEILRLALGVSQYYDKIMERVEHERLRLVDGRMLLDVIAKAKALNDELRTLREGDEADEAAKKKAAKIATGLSDLEEQLKERAWQDETADDMQKVLTSCTRTREAALEFAGIFSRKD